MQGLRLLLCACAALLGLAPAASAVFHGAPVAPAQAPWLVALTARGHVGCGGVLIRPDRVLTAAHCVQGVDPAAVHLRLGAARWQDGRSLRWRGAIFPTTYRPIPSSVDPTDPQRAGAIDDLAVLRLSAPVTDVAPAPVAAEPPAPGEESLTIGRGRTGPFPRQAGPDVADPGAAAATPAAAIQGVADPAACAAAYGTTLFHAQRHLCTQDATPAAAQSCTGDSGSPVLVRRDGALAVAGVVSWGGETQGRDCGAGLPDVAERVAPHAALLDAAVTAYAPWAQRRVRVRRAGDVLTCMVGRWQPASTTFRVRWFRMAPRRTRRDPDSGVTVLVPGRRSTVAGTARTHRAGTSRLGCEVTGTTTGGTATEVSYNLL